MKKVWNEEFLQGLEELSCEESARIIGGESLWYWIGYGIGSVSRFISQASGEQSAGQRAMNAALG